MLMQQCYVEPESRLMFELKLQFYMGIIVLLLLFAYFTIRKLYEYNQIKKLKEGNDKYE